MSTMDIEAPAPLTWDNTGGYDGDVIPEPSYDPLTVSLRDSLNSQVPYVPTSAPTFPVYVRTQDNGPGDRSYSPDGVYTQPYDYLFTSRWGAMNYDPMIQPMIVRHESPEVPFSYLSYNELIAESTQSMNQGAPGQQLTTALRAPLINEGM